MGYQYDRNQFYGKHIPYGMHCLLCVVFTLCNFKIFQEWLTEYLASTKLNYYSYLAEKQFQSRCMDAFLIRMAAYYMGKPITIVSCNGMWSTDPTVNHDIVLIYRGNQGFIDMNIGNRMLLIVLFFFNKEIMRLRNVKFNR